jgi:hypothetical protein
MRFCCGSSYLTALGKYKVSNSTDPGMTSRFPDAHEIFGGHSFSFMFNFFTKYEKIIATQILCNMKSAWHIISDVETKVLNLPQFPSMYSSNNG